MSFDISKYKEFLEGNRLEVLDARHGLPNSLLETYSAMANCYGGVILLGVEENPDGSFKTTGLKNVRRLKRDLCDLLYDSQKVSVNLLTDSDLKSYEVDGDMILAIHIPRARRVDRPVYINNDVIGGTYRRGREGDYHCSRAEVDAMLRDQTEETSDMKVLNYKSMSKLNMNSVRAYRNCHRSYRPGHVWEGLEDNEYLEMIGAARRSKIDGNLHPTAAGLLMFGEKYTIFSTFLGCRLEYIDVFGPTTRSINRMRSEDFDWEGNLFELFLKVNSMMIRNLKIPYKLEGFPRMDDTPVHKALREALVNCLVNTYFHTQGEISIINYQDEIVLENPGSIRVGKDQMLKGGISDPRNKAIMKMFNLIGIGQHEGSGIQYIFSVWDSQGWRTPEVEEQYSPDRTILKLSFKKKDEETPSLNPLESTSFNTTE